MCGWVLAVFISALCWGSGDTIFDTIIDAHQIDDEDKSKTKYAKVSLSHSQTMFLCAFTTYLIVFLYSMFIMYTSTSYLTYFHDVPSMFFLNNDYRNVYVLLFSGIFSYYHYHFMVRAFEHSSSTVILPFLQFSSIFTFFLSMIEKYLSDLPWISSSSHIVAYLLILVGGLTPATEGNLLLLFQPKFWTQPFVKYALLADGSHAIYTVIISFVGGESSGEFNFFSNMEFFVLTRSMSSVIFLLYLITNQRIQKEVIQLYYKPRYLIITTVICEVLTLIGYFSSLYAYQCYYQPGVVSASESSLNLVINLLLAYGLKSYFNIGREASLQVFYKFENKQKNFKLKTFACLLISLGLIIANN